MTIKAEDSLIMDARRVLQRSHERGADPYNQGGGGKRPWLRQFDRAAVEEETLNSTTLSGHRFDELLERGERILAIRTDDLPGTLDQFESFARQSGKAIYLWRPEEGLRSLKVTDMSVPGSTRMADALRYVANSMHYGVYGFVGFDRQLNLQCTQLLRDIAGNRTGYDRKVILLGEDFRLPGNLKALTARIEHRPARQLRLRDGRWVV